jgi:hypothetical protein
VKFAGSITGALDPAAFWLAWSRGSATTTDTFADGWDLWAVAAMPLERVRADYAVPPLDPGLAGSSALPAGYRPSA